MCGRRRSASKPLQPNIFPKIPGELEHRLEVLVRSHGIEAIIGR